MTTRRQFLHSVAGTTAVVLTPSIIGASLACQENSSPDSRNMTSTTKTKSTTTKMPVLFVGHGSPINAITDNEWSQGFKKLGALVPEPTTILAISAHWYVNGTYLTDNEQPKTIHDFSGFPPKLHEVQYPAPGSLDLAKRVRNIIGRKRSALSSDWGLDHGTWSVLRWMFPKATIPVVQLSINRRLTVSEHLDLARSLTELREEGVLVFGSGNVTHNLRDAFSRGRRKDTTTPDWAQRFDLTLTEVIEQRDEKALLDLWPSSDDGRMCHPSGDHYLPIIYAYGATTDSDRVSYPIEGWDSGSLSMRSILFS